MGEFVCAGPIGPNSGLQRAVPEDAASLRRCRKLVVKYGVERVGKVCIGGHVAWTGGRAAK